MQNRLLAARKGRIFAAASTALLLLVGSVFGAVTAANAAPVVTYPDAISNIALERDDDTDGPLHQWNRVMISADWSVPDGAVEGETFGMTLPTEFRRWGTGEFPIVDPVTKAIMANCVVSQDVEAEVVCTLTAEVNGQLNVGGSSG